ncbi:hypothetical protein NWF32_14650 [Pseudomonas qingdaonensis]|nr:hypothetical protein [Pseudomonas qingdaonensis]
MNDDGADGWHIVSGASARGRWACQSAVVFAARGGVDVLGVCDPALAAASIASWRGVNVLGGDEVLEQFDVEQVGLVNGIGQVLGSSLRRDIFLS